MRRFSTLLAHGNPASSNGICQLQVSEQGVAHLTLTHTQKRNSLSLQMVETLYTHVRALRDNKQVRFMVLRAEGPVFSSGHNLVELKEMSRDQAQVLFKTSTLMMRDLQNLPFPILAQIDGLAAAAGLQLVAHCDMAVATTKSTFSTPGIRFGLFCSSPGTALFRSTYAPKALSHMLYTGEAISADEAQRIGIISHQFPDATTMEQWTSGVIERVLSLPRDGIALGKSAFLRQSQMRNSHEAMLFASDIMTDNLGLDTCKEGLDAFATKRKPKW